MRQKISDLISLLRQDRRLLAAGIFIAAVLVIWALTERPDSRIVHVLPGDPQHSKNLPDDAVKDFMFAYKGDLDELRNNEAERAAVIRRFKADLDEVREQTSGILEALTDQLENLYRDFDLLKRSVPGGGITPPPPPEEPPFEPELTRFGYDDPQIPQAPLPPRVLRSLVVAAGDSVHVELLTGVEAPVDGTPYPVVFRLIGPITGPGGTYLDLGDARIIAAAQGSKTDSRAVFRLSSLAIAYPDGRREVIPVDGWIVGEDGIRGLSGKLNDKLGRFILATAGVSFAAALGDRFTDKTNRQTYDQGSGSIYGTSGNDLDYASVSALTDASNRLGKVLLDHYESYVPVVEVLASRPAVAIFSQTAEIGILDDLEDLRAEID